MAEGLVVAFRAVVAFVTLMIFARLIGKTQVSQMTFFEYIFGITIGSAASTLTTSLNERPWPIWVGLAVWTILIILTQKITLRWHKISKALDGEPTIIIQNGKVIEENLLQAGYRTTDLLQQLREKNVFNIADVEFALLENSGHLSVLKKADKEPLTPADMQIPVSYQGLPTELIYDGVINKNNMSKLGLEERWLRDQLNQHGIFDVRQVSYAQIDAAGKLYIDLKQASDNQRQD